MNPIIDGCRGWLSETAAAAVKQWNQFWFNAGDVRILGILRILIGAFALYSHVIWTVDFDAFFLRDGAIDPNYGSLLNENSPFFWSHFQWIESSGVLWALHVVAAIVFVMMIVGFATPVTSVLSFLLVVSYTNRAFGALFGMDQVLAFMSFYLAIGPSGKAFSVDAWLRRRRGVTREVQLQPSVRANISVRLIQFHMCIVYLFAGLSKLQGESWWRGDAIWGAMASYEYQTIDMTWMANYMWMINAMTLASLVFEISYPFVIWHRWARPFYLLTAVILHLGIGLGMGMMTFGLIMIVGNTAFLAPRSIATDTAPQDDPQTA